MKSLIVYFTVIIVNWKQQNDVDFKRLNRHDIEFDEMWCDRIQCTIIVENKISAQVKKGMIREKSWFLTEIERKEKDQYILHETDQKKKGIGIRENDSAQMNKSKQAWKVKENKIRWNKIRKKFKS